MLLAPVNQPERVPVEKRFDPELVSEKLRAKGVNATTHKSVDDMIDYLAQNTSYGDVILIMSNGGFGGIYAKLMDVFRG